MTGPESATSLEEFVGAAFGEDPGGSPAGATTDDEPPTQTGSEAPGAPPGAAPQNPNADESAEDGDAEDEPSNADGATDETTSRDATTTDDADPLADAQPLTYTVNGEARNFDGIHVLKDMGAVVDADALPNLVRRLTERDHLYETSQQQHRQYQDLERLTSWKTTGADGTEQVLTGPDAIEALKVSHGQLTAAVQVLGGLLDNPAQLIGLLAQDEQGRVTVDQAQLDHLTTKIQLASMNAERAVRGHLTELKQSATQATTQQQLQTQAPHLLWASAESTWMKDVPLTADDKTFLQAQLPRYIRPATADEVQTGQFQPNEPVLDYSFKALIDQMAKSRSTTAQVATQSSQAAKENAARLAAAARGKTPQKPQDRTTSRSPRETRGQSAGSAFALLERASSGRFADADA